MATQRTSLEPAAATTNMARKFHIRSHTTIPTKTGVNNLNSINSITSSSSIGNRTTTFTGGFRREQTSYSLCNENYIKTDPVPMVSRPRTAKAISEAFKGLVLPPRKPSLASPKNGDLVFCHLDRKFGSNQSSVVGQKLKNVGIVGKSVLRVSTPSPPPDDEDDDLNSAGAEFPSSKPTVDDIKKRLYTRECTKLGVTPVGAFLRAPSRTELCLPHYSLGPVGARALSVPLMLDSTLTTLNLEGNGLGPEGMVNLREVLTDHCAITHLNLKRNKLGYKGALVACQVLQTNRLISTLNVSANQIDDKAGIFFANMLKANSQLRSLDLSDNNLAGVTGRQLGGALNQNETLEQLDLCWNQFSGGGAVKLLEGVSENIGLKHLALAYNCFGKGQGGRQSDSLVNVLRSNSTLLSLDISSNRLVDVDILAVARGLADNTSLHTLKVGRNLVGVSAANSLLSVLLAKESSTVTVLDMSDLPISQADLVKVEELRTRNIQVVHGRIHQTETDFQAKPSSHRPKSGQLDRDGDGDSPQEDFTGDMKGGTGPVATYVATTEKPPDLQDSDEHQLSNQVEEISNDENIIE